MKIFIILSLMSTNTFAQNIFVHANDMTQENFSTKINITDGISLVDYVKTRPSLQNLDSLRVSADLQVIDAAISQLQKLPLRKLDVEILVGLFHRKFELALPDKFEKSEIKRIFGLLQIHKDLQEIYFTLWSQLSSKISERIEYYRDLELAELQNQLATPDSLLLVDGAEVSYENLQQISKTPHQWVRISNTHYPTIVVGELSDFLTQTKLQTEFTAKCNEEISVFSPNSPLKIKRLSNDSDCTSIIANTTYNTQNLTNKKKIDWLTPTVVVLGLLTAAQMKDKKLVVTVPSLKF